VNLYSDLHYKTSSLLRKEGFFLAPRCETLALPLTMKDVGGLHGRRATKKVRVGWFMFTSTDVTEVLSTFTKI